MTALLIHCHPLPASASVLLAWFWKQFSTIQNMKIFLHMAHGDLSSYYGGMPMEGLPFQGMCQGNSAGPALWLVTSIPLIDMLCHHRGHLFFLMSSQQSIHLACQPTLCG